MLIEELNITQICYCVCLRNKSDLIDFFKLFNCFWSIWGHTGNEKKNIKVTRYILLKIIKTFYSSYQKYITMLESFLIRLSQNIMYSNSHWDVHLLLQHKWNSISRLSSVTDLITEVTKWNKLVSCILYREGFFFISWQHSDFWWNTYCIKLPEFELEKLLK